jgi:hypothetical protein
MDQLQYFATTAGLLIGWTLLMAAIVAGAESVIAKFRGPR